MSAPPTVGRATIEELTLIRDYIMMPHLLTMCDRSLQDVGRSGNLFAKHFEKFIQLVMDGITRDLNTIRREFRIRQIKVWDDEMRDGILYSKYSCRGYEDRFGVVREALRTEMSLRLAKYATSVFNPEVITTKE